MRLGSVVSEGSACNIKHGMYVHYFQQEPLPHAELAPRSAIPLSTICGPVAAIDQLIAWTLNSPSL